nr:hypothetical protein Iba_chr02dCG8210 [Ipomoea batatas]GMC67104.1 hypothetical protein Iba_chr02eCG11890 [Ipomoea batatas]
MGRNISRSPLRGDILVHGRRSITATAAIEASGTIVAHLTQVGEEVIQGHLAIAEVAH